MSRLEELCRPFISLVCARAVSARAGVNVSAAAVKDEIKAALEAIRAKCADDLVLRREFERVEKPLVFFADYCLKDGDTQLAREWSDLGREYSELSGDEKFYDMLSSALEDPESSERLRMFYLLLGLGFDGVHRGDGDYVQRRMKLCAARFATGDDPTASLRPDIRRPFAGKARVRSPLAACFLLALLFAAAAFAFNYCCLCSETRAYADALDAAYNHAERYEINAFTPALKMEVK